MRGARARTRGWCVWVRLDGCRGGKLFHTGRRVCVRVWKEDKKSWRRGWRARARACVCRDCCVTDGDRSAAADGVCGARRRAILGESRSLELSNILFQWQGGWTSARWSVLGRLRENRNDQSLPSILLLLLLTHRSE